MNIMKLAHRFRRLVWFVTRPVMIGVRAILVRDDEVLLVKHTYQDEWYIPGGGVKRGETLEQAVRREVREETGSTVNTMDLFGVYTGYFDFMSNHTIVFVSTDFTPGAFRSLEIEEAVFFPIHNLPEPMSPGSRRRIEEYLAGGPVSAGDW